MKHHMVFFSDLCSPSIAHFNSRAEAEMFVALFKCNHSDNTDDYWVDCIVEGNIVKKFSGFSGITEHKKKTTKKRKAA